MLCREEAADLASLQKAGKLGKANVIGVIKEVAPCATAKTDEELGVQEFQDQYWPFPLYLDESKEFYSALGSRTFSDLPGTWNPFEFWKGLKSPKYDEMSFFYGLPATRRTNFQKCL